MPQFGLFFVLVLLPLQMLSGGQTPRESMPELVQGLMLVAPTTHYVMLAQAILFRGAGIWAVWLNFVALAAIGSGLFVFSLGRLRKSLAEIR
jgi:ABC-2 type transport system permease protein